MFWPEGLSGERREEGSAIFEKSAMGQGVDHLSSHRSALSKTVATAAVLHGTFTVGLPLVILQWADDVSSLMPYDIGPLRWLGAAVVGFGIYLYSSTASRLRRSHTPAIPGAKPTVLVTDGWYARTRHPLLLGVVSILFGEAVLFSSPALAGYALIYWLWLTVFVMVKEEPDLRQAFGAQFDAYCRAVPRWISRS